MVWIQVLLEALVLHFYVYNCFGLQFPESLTVSHNGLASAKPNPYESCGLKHLESQMSGVIELNNLPCLHKHARALRSAREAFCIYSRKGSVG